MAGGYYHFVKFFNYEEANPGQDSAGAEGFEATVIDSSQDAGSGPQVDRGDRAAASGSAEGLHPGYGGRMV